MKLFVMRYQSNSNTITNLPYLFYHLDHWFASRSHFVSHKLSCSHLQYKQKTSIPTSEDNTLEYGPRSLHCSNEYKHAVLTKRNIGN